MKENPSKTSGSIAAMTVESTGERRHGSFVNSGSKLLADFFPRYERKKKTVFINDCIPVDGLMVLEISI